MSNKRDPASLGRYIAMAKALWDLYWKVVVPGAIYLDGEIKKRRRRKKEEKEGKKKKEESPYSKRLRKLIEKDKKKREAELLKKTQDKQRE